MLENFLYYRDCRLTYFVRSRNDLTKKKKNEQEQEPRQESILNVNRERGAGNVERGTGNGERRTENGERKSENE